MKLSKLRLLSCLPVAALLAGCGGNAQTVPGAPQTSQAASTSGQRMISSIAAGLPTIRSERSGGESWIKPNLAGQALLYVANYLNGTVSVFAYNGGNSPQLVGTLSGFVAPLAACSDNKGNVFIGDSGTVTEFAHGAATPTQVLQDPQSTPQGCAVDPTTGNLAVINFGCSCGSGNVAIYTNATGTPKIYTNAKQALPESAAFDSKGNLVIDGRNRSAQTSVFEVMKGSTKFIQLTVKGGTINYPGQVLWGGTYMLIGDQQYQGQNQSAVYQTTVKGRTLTIRGTIPFAGTTDVFGFAKRGSGSAATIAAADVASSEGFVYSFPAGDQISSFSGMDGPVGVAISQAGS